MAAVKQLAVINFFIITFCSAVIGCEDSDVIAYKVTLRTLWSEDVFPKDYPVGKPRAQWSSVFGQSHNASYALYHVGEVGRPSLRKFAQDGKTSVLVEESEEDSRIHDQFIAKPIGSGVGTTEGVVFVDGSHSRVSMVSRMVPSPDWFIGVDSIDLCIGSSWVDQIILDLEPLDAGASNGLTFTSSAMDTSPPGEVSKHQPRDPNHVIAAFYYPMLKDLPPIANVEFVKVKEYTSKEINDLARKELKTDKRQLDNNELPQKPMVSQEYDDYQEEDDAFLSEEMTTKNSLQQLMDLEEEPVGTPKPNVAKNDVIVVTDSPSMGVPEADSGEDLSTMDDVVLAVAHGRRLGLGKHLPRHFKSRLHHAVNRAQPYDCKVSEWSEWTACSSRCSLGEKYRYRNIIRAKRGDGRDCPQLFEKTHCLRVC